MSTVICFAFQNASLYIIYLKMENYDDDFTFHYIMKVCIMASCLTYVKLYIIIYSSPGQYCLSRQVGSIQLAYVAVLLVNFCMKYSV